jgi:hypothetical protein
MSALGSLNSVGKSDAGGLGNSVTELLQSVSQQLSGSGADDVRLDAGPESAQDAKPESLAQLARVEFEGVGMNVNITA